MDTCRRILWIAGAAVIAAGAFAELGGAVGFLDPDGAIVPALSLSYEQNLPTWYSTILLFTAGLLLGFLARRSASTGNPDARRWWGLAGLVLYMSLDENIEIHEYFGDFVELDGAFYFGWILPGSALVLLVTAAYGSFLLRLPPATRRRLVIAAGVYLTGALAMELPLGYWTSIAGDDNVVYAAIDVLEESLEITGASLLVLGLLEHLRTLGVRIDWGPR